VTPSPLHHVFAFWKPLIDRGELDALAAYGEPGERRPRTINVWRAVGEPRHYRVIEGEARYSLFAAVHPIDAVPESAVALAQVVDMAGNHHSFVLWDAGERSAVVPFDPDAAVEAMWFERHVPEARRTVLPMPVLALYYSVKRLIPASVRRRLRRIVARKARGEAESFLSWPSDRSLDLTMRLMLRIILLTLGRESLPFVWFWPERRPWAVVLTHDVESAAGLANAPHVAEIEGSRGLHSSFNIVPYDYVVPGSTLAHLREAGSEIGVHGYKHDGLLFSTWSRFLERVVAVNECGRQWGAAGFRSPATYRNLEWFHLLGFEYDSTVTDTAPFEPQPGGCASVFPYFVGDLVELPMTLPQDHTLFSLLRLSDARVWLAKLAEIEAANGMACVLAHPDPGEGYIGRPDNEAHYVEVLDRISSSDAWTPLPRDLARWWRERSTIDTEAGDMPSRAAIGTAALDGRGALSLTAPTA